MSRLRKSQPRGPRRPSKDRMTITYEFLRDRPDLKVGLYREGGPREYFSTWCPLHDDVEVPSLMVYKGDALDVHDRSHSGYWKCLAGCGVGGLDVLWRRITFPGAARRYKTTPATVEWKRPYIPMEHEAMEKLAVTAHIILKRYPDLGWYIEDRGVSDMIDPCNLGYHNGWITIPVYDRQGEIETLMMRATPPIEKASKIRFHSPNESHPHVYVPNWKAFDKAKKVAVVFGMFDALTMADLVIPAITPTHGNDTLDVTWLPRDKKYVIIPDAKPNEVKSAESIATRMKVVGIRYKLARLPYEDGIKDPNGWLEKGRRQDLERALAKWF